MTNADRDRDCRSNLDRARELMDALDTYGPVPPELRAHHQEAVASALDAAEERGCRWGIEAHQDWSHEVMMERIDGSEPLDPAAVVAERRAP